MYVEALFDVPLGADSLFSTKCLVTSAGTQVTSEEGGEGVAQTDHSQRWFQWENTKVPYWNRLAVEIKLLAFGAPQVPQSPEGGNDYAFNLRFVKRCRGSDS